MIADHHALPDVTFTPVHARQTYFFARRLYGIWFVLLYMMSDEAMSEYDKQEALGVGQKIQAQYYQQNGQMLDLRDLERAISSGYWTAVNREVIKLTIKAASKPQTLS